MSGRHAAPRRAEPRRPARRRAASRRTAPRPTRPWTPVVVALVGALGLVGGLGTQAYWNDVETVAGATVTSGSLDLKVADQDDYSWTLLDLDTIAPGESLAEALTVTNAGTTPFTVSVTAAATATVDALRQAMLVTVTRDGAVVPESLVYPRSESCSGTVTYGAAAVAVAGTAVLGPSATIAPGGSLTICVRLFFDTGAGNGTQNHDYTPTFTVTATQVAP